MDDFIKGGIGAVAGAVGMLFGLVPRLSRIEKDLEKKIDSTVFEEVKAHIDTKFDAHGRELGEIKKGVHALVERMEKDRQ